MFQTNTFFFLVTVIHFPLATSVWAKSDNIDIQGVIARHEAGISVLQSFHVVSKAFASEMPSVVERLNFFSDKRERKIKHVYDAEWIVDGEFERIRFTPTIQTTHPHSGLPSNILDIAIKDKKLYCLQEWDPKKPQPISPSEQGSVRAQIILSTSDFRWRDPSFFNLFRPRFNTSDPRSGMRDFVGRFSNKKVLKDSDSHCLIWLQNDSGGHIKSDEHVEVEFSKAHNWLVSKFSMIRDTNKIGVQPGDIWSAMHHSVKEFSDCGSGVFFPKEVERNVVDAASGIGIITSLWKNTEFISVNRPISSDQFTMVFPKDCVVKDAATQKGVMRWVLWGERNEPFKQVKDAYELRQLDKTPVSRRSSNKMVWIAAYCGAILLAGWIAWKYFRRS